MSGEIKELAFAEGVAVSTPTDTAPTSLMTNWTTYSPSSPTAWSFSTTEAFYRRSGDTFFGWFSGTLDAAPTGTFTWLPTQYLAGLSLTVDTAKFPTINTQAAIFGNWVAVDDSEPSTSDNYGGQVKLNQTGNITLIVAPDIVDQTDPFTWASPDSISVAFAVPIVEWAF